MSLCLLIQRDIPLRTGGVRPNVWKNASPCISKQWYWKLSCLILISPIWFSNLPGREIFCRKALSETCKNEWKQLARFPFILFLSNVTLGCVHVFRPLRRTGIPLNKLFILRSRLFRSSQKITPAKACWSRRCEGTYQHKRDVFQKIPCKIWTE